MPLKRTKHWLTRELDAFLRDHAHDTFAWGKNDCCLFAADALEAFTGVDIADDFRGRYDDEVSAFALIKTVTGGETVADAAAHCAAKHSLTEWANKDGKPLPLMARRGDLCIVDNAGRMIAGIVDLSGAFVACMGEAGIIRLSIRRVVRAWHVPA